MEPRSRDAAKTPVFVVIACLGLVQAMALGHALLGLLGKAAMNLRLFFAWHAAFYALTLLLVLLFRRRMQAFSVQARVAVILWAGLVFWYCLPAPAFFVLSMSLDAWQVKWTAMMWFWELLVFGGGLFVLVPVLIFRRLVRRLQTSRADPAALYAALVRFPLRASTIVFVATVLGWWSAALQFGLFAFMPVAEQLKIIFGHAFIDSIWLCVFYYLSLDSALAGLRGEVERRFGLKDVVKRSVSRRIFGITLGTVLGAIALLGIFVWQSFQTLVKEHVESHLLADLTDLERRQHGPHGRVFVLGSGEAVPLRDLAPETHAAVAERPFGVVEDSRGSLKLVAFRNDPRIGKTVVSVVSLEDFYGPLQAPAQLLGLLALLVTILAVGISTFMSRASTKAVRLLSSAVRQAVARSAPYATDVHTADELEELSHAFAYFIGQSEEFRRRLEEKVQELARSNAELEQFAYVASHDLQEPLRMVAGYMQLMARRYKGRLDEDADQFIGYAVGGAMRMQQLINDLLAYSRVGTRGKPFEPTACGQVVGQILANLQVAIQETGAVVTHDGLPTVEGDPVQLAQLFQNLLGNAIKFRKPGEPPRIHVRAQRNGAEWVFAVSDNGIGIDPRYQERIFVIFQRLHSEHEYAGTGIGLAVCKKIVERHGGRMWVESQPDQGATFYFSLPARPASAQPPGGLTG
jgi:signal transduction histidine kinase